MRRRERAPAKGRSLISIDFRSAGAQPAVMSPTDASLPSPPPKRFNIARYCLAAGAAATPDKTALIVVGGGGEDRRWSYGELDLAVRCVAGGVGRLGAKPRQRLVVRVDNDGSYILTFFGAPPAALVRPPSWAGSRS